MSKKVINFPTAKHSCVKKEGHFSMKFEKSDHFFHWRLNTEKFISKETSQKLIHLIAENVYIKKIQ